MKFAGSVGVLIFSIYCLELRANEGSSPFQYKQYSEYFSEKVVPTPKTPFVTLGKIASVTKGCVKGLIENVTRSIYRDPKGYLEFEPDHEHFSMSQNGPSYGAYTYSSAARFKSQQPRRIYVYLSQSSVLSKQIVVDQVTRRTEKFYWNGPFSMNIGEIEENSFTHHRFYPFKLQSLASFLKDEDEDESMTWGYNMGLPILHASLVNGDDLPDNKYLGMEDEKEFRELNLFYPFYFQTRDPSKDLGYLHIDGIPTDIAFSRREYADCLKNGIQN